MSDHLPFTALVTRAANGDQQAWDTPLIWSICRRYQLSDADAEDVGQAVWLQLTGQLRQLRDPAAIPGWLATTTRRECVRVLRASRGPQAATYMSAVQTIPDQQTRTAEQELLAAGQHAALREAFTRLPPCCQQLIALLTEDPAVPYAQISAKLNTPAASIGPRRGRCLDKLRRDPAIAALINPEAASAGSEPPRQAAAQQ